mmetsp:Transcript_3685/g.7668  ORF Transcript_3685/g.7668 Transcript_3685/m.7668 type:complete len:1400 (+) Transcript_3685:140-4339(+)
MAPKAKVAAKPAAKAPAKASGGYPAAKSTAKIAEPRLAPLDYASAQKLVSKTEMKLDDLEEEMKGCTGTQEKKRIAAEVKKYKEYERYIESKALIQEHEANLEREAMKKKSTGISTTNIVKADEGADSGVAKDMEVDTSATMDSAKAKYTAILSASGEAAKVAAARKFGAQTRHLGIDSLLELGVGDKIKKQLADKDKEQKLIGFCTIAGLGWATPVVAQFLPTALAGTCTASLAACKAITGQAAPHAIGEFVMPELIKGLSTSKWKVQMRAIQCVPGAWFNLSHSSSVATSAPIMLPIVMASLQHVRSEVIDASLEACQEVLASVYNPEVRSLSSLLISALKDPSKQELTWAALGKLSNTTFMNYIDAGSLAFIMPILQRALRERSHESKKKGARIAGSVLILVYSKDTIRPYMPLLLPLLKEAVVDTSPEVQWEAATAVGNLATYMTDIFDAEFGPWLFGCLKSEDINERQGAARSLADCLLKLPDRREEVIARAVATCLKSDVSPLLRAGAFEVLDACSDLLKDDFGPFVPLVLPAVLSGAAETDEDMSAPAGRAAKTVVGWFSDGTPKVLMSGFEAGMTNEDERCRVNTVSLVQRAIEKILGRRKDFLKCECPLTMNQRCSLLATMYISRSDPSNDVRRAVNGFWPIAVQSIKDTFPSIVGHVARRIREFTEGTATEKTLATRALADLQQNPVWDPEADKSNGSAEGNRGPVADLKETLAAYDTTVHQADLESVSESDKILDAKVAKAVAHVEGVTPEVQQYLRIFCTSVAHTCKCLFTVEEALDHGLIGFLDDQQRKKLALAIEDVMELRRPETEDGKCETTLCRVESLFLCYGGGKLLLRDTTLELLKDHRYGVVGRNGAGKTTLMNQMSGGGLAGMPPDLKCVHVKHEILQEIQELTPVDFCKREVPSLTDKDISYWLNDVGFPEHLKTTKVAELSGGFCMRLILAVGMMAKPDVLLLDEPTNHLDQASCDWLADYLNNMKTASVMVISHEPAFLDKVCTDIIQYRDMKMVYFKGNFQAFRDQAGISDADCAEILDGGPAADQKKGEGDESGEDGEKLVGYGTGGKSKMNFPIPCKLTGVSSTKAVLELDSVSFQYSPGSAMILKDVNLKVAQTSRIAISGKNGSGKSTLLSLIAGELNPVEGDVNRHRNLRIAYIAQNQMFHLSEFLNITPYAYIQIRFKNGYDEMVQRRLLEPKDDEEAAKRRELAKDMGKYGNEVETIVGRTVKGKELYYEVQWKNLPDEKQNTTESLSKLKAMGVEGQARAFDERNAILSNAADTRALPRREIVKHCEMFGLDEDMVCNRQIGGFSAGQKSKLTLSAAMWTRPQVIALDEPTNYVDVETLDAIAKALKTFRGGTIVSSRDNAFLDKVCTETWMVEDGTVTVSKRQRDE